MDGITTWLADACRRLALPARSCFALALLAVWLTGAAEDAPINARTLGVLVNSNDPESVRAGQYYLEARGIPAANLVRVKLPVGKSVLKAEAFTALRARITRQAPAGIRAWAVMWRKPYRVDCMSITSALAFGFDEAWCARGCARTRHSPWFNSALRDPAATLAITPAMMVQGPDLAATRALIDRGVAADGTRPDGSAWLVETADRARSVRAMFFPDIVSRYREQLPIAHVKRDALKDRDDILFYFTGAKRVEHLEDNDFVPGAIADHLTSFGGRLDSDRQMTVMAWIKAGASGSYGTVVEPCNFPQKFPHPAVVIGRYLAGEPLIEAYWKSVLMPGQGLFVGEPLARPFGPGPAAY